MTPFEQTAVLVGGLPASGKSRYIKTLTHNHIMPAVPGRAPWEVGSGEPIVGVILQIDRFLHQDDDGTLYAQRSYPFGPKFYFEEDPFPPDVYWRLHGEMLAQYDRWLRYHDLNVVVETTFHTRALREMFVTTAKDLGVKVHMVWHDADPNLLFERNAQRSPKVPEWRLREMIVELDVPDTSVEERLDVLEWRVQCRRCQKSQ